MEGTKGPGCGSPFQVPLLSLQEQGPECEACGLKGLHLAHGLQFYPPRPSLAVPVPGVSLVPGCSSASPSMAQAGLCPLSHSASAPSPHAWHPLLLALRQWVALQSGVKSQRPGPRQSSQGYRYGLRSIELSGPHPCPLEDGGELLTSLASQDILKVCRRSGKSQPRGPRVMWALSWAG